MFVNLMATATTGQEGRCTSKLRCSLLLNRIVTTKLYNSSYRLGYLTIRNGDDNANEISGAETCSGQAKDGLLTDQ